MKKILGAVAAVATLATTATSDEVKQDAIPTENPSMYCTDDGNGVFSMYHKSFADKPVVTVDGEVDVFENTSVRTLRGNMIGFSEGYHTSPGMAIAGEFSSLAKVDEVEKRVFTIDYTKGQCSIKEDIGDGVIASQITMPFGAPAP